MEERLVLIQLGEPGESECTGFTGIRGARDYGIEYFGELALDLWYQWVSAKWSAFGSRPCRKLRLTGDSSEKVGGIRLNLLATSSAVFLDHTWIPCMKANRASASRSWIALRADVIARITLISDTDAGPPVSLSDTSVRVAASSLEDAASAVPSHLLTDLRQR